MIGRFKLFIILNFEKTHSFKKTKVNKEVPSNAHVLGLLIKTGIFILYLLYLFIKYVYYIEWH